MKNNYKFNPLPKVRPPYASYTTRNQYEAAIHLEKLIKEAVVTKEQLISMPSIDIKRQYLPICDSFQIIQSLSLIK